MRRNQASRAIVNRRRVRRRRRAIAAPRSSERPLLASLERSLRSGASRLHAAIATWRAVSAEKALTFFVRLRQAVKIAGEHIRASGARGLAWAGKFGQRSLAAFSLVRRDLSAIRRYLLARIARFWAVANSEVELPQVNLAPFFRVAGALFAVVAVAVAGFTAWQVTRGGQNADKPAVVAAPEHYSPGVGPDAGLTALQGDGLTGDVEADFVTLASGPEDDTGMPSPRIIAGIPDIDAQGGYDIAATGPEEKLVAALSPPPRANRRPTIPQPPVVSGIPLQPEPPAGPAPAQPAWLANAIEPRRLGKGPMIAIVIDDAGVAQERSKRASDLPAPLTIAFIPYSDNLESQTRYARLRGHELMLHIPMEPGSADTDPGHNALLTSLSEDEIMRRFRWALDRFDGYVGVNNHMGSKFMARGDLVRPVLEEINSRGLLFLDSRTDHRTVGTRLARDMGMPHATRNVFLDNDLDAAKIRAQLAELERVARRRGHAIAIGHPHDVTTETLADWIPEARARGFQLVPVSTIVKLEYGPRLASAAAGGESDGLLGGAQ